VHGVKGRRRAASAVCVATALALAACTGGSSSQAPTTSSPTTATVPGPSATLTPEQQAVEEARAALASYQRTVNSVYQAGGQDPKMRLSKVAQGEQLAFLVQDAARLRQNGWRQVGSTSAKNIRIESVRLTGKPQILLSFCLDASRTDGVDAKGKSIRKPGASPFFEARLTLVKQPEGGWLVSQEDDKPVKSC
jgi:hypothetical protein